MNDPPRRSRRPGRLAAWNPPRLLAATLLLLSVSSAAVAEAGQVRRRWTQLGGPGSFTLNPSPRSPPPSPGRSSCPSGSQPAVGAAGPGPGGPGGPGGLELRAARQGPASTALRLCARLVRVGQPHPLQRHLLLPCAAQGRLRQLPVHGGPFAFAAPSLLDSHHLSHRPGQLRPPLPRHTAAHHGPQLTRCYATPCRAAGAAVPAAAAVHAAGRHGGAVLLAHHEPGVAVHPEDAAQVRRRCGGAQGGRGGAAEVLGGPGQDGSRPAGKSRACSHSGPRAPCGCPCSQAACRAAVKSVPATHTRPHGPCPVGAPASAPAVTFVAMGNGAPDLSSNISAIRGGGVLLSAGAITGGAEGEGGGGRVQSKAASRHLPFQQPDTASLL
jgi:hypothetical protein